MITTGFNFEWIWLIWIILLEQELLVPKYNTEENIYSNIVQLIWRWNRNWEKTDIIIQTFIPENNIINKITCNNYKNYFLDTLKERKQFNYPPYSKILTLEYRHKDKNKSKIFMEKLKKKLDIKNNWINNEIIFINNVVKKNNNYFTKIIIKWVNIRKFLQTIKKEIFSNSKLSILFQ